MWHYVNSALYLVGEHTQSQRLCCGRGSFALNPLALSSVGRSSAVSFQSLRRQPSRSLKYVPLVFAVQVVTPLRFHFVSFVSTLRFVRRDGVHPHSLTRPRTNAAPSLFILKPVTLRLWPACRR